MPTTQPDNTYNLWPLRFAVITIMLLLVFVGVIFTYVEPLSSRIVWYYWTYMAPCFALICIAYSWFIRHRQISLLTSLWQDALLWAGMLMAHFILHIAVLSGFFSRVETGLFTVDLMAFATFCAGIMLDSCFYLVSIALFLFALSMVMFFRYIIAVLLLVTIATILSLLFLRKRKRKQQ